MAMNELAMDYPSEDDEAVLEVLKEEGRASPKLIRDRTGLDKGDVNTALVRAGRHGDVKQVVRGLYDYTGDDTGGHVDAAAIESALDDLEAALERGDRQAALQALHRARDELGR